MSPTGSPFELQSLKALTFDVFGTTVTWRTPITLALTSAAKSKTSSPSFALLPPQTQQTLLSLHPSFWPTFAQEWRTSYIKFTHSFTPSPSAPWTSIDTHHQTSLTQLLAHHNLPNIFTPFEITHLSQTWHFLPPHPDSSPGVQALSQTYTTAALSNGNRSLLSDLNTHAKLGFQQLISAEDFKAYKPDPATYLGACRMLGYEPGEVAMVAAHLGDLEAASRCGMRTIYVERSGEEDWEMEEERYAGARKWVDLWVGEGEGGFVEVARRLGL